MNQGNHSNSHINSLNSINQQERIWYIQYIPECYEVKQFDSCFFIQKINPIICDMYPKHKERKSWQ